MFQRICRLGGFSFGLKGGMRNEEPPDRNNWFSDPQTVNGRDGQSYLRCTVNAERPANAEIESDFFELWSTTALPGFIIVEKVPQLVSFFIVMKFLFHLNYILDETFERRTT